MRAIALTGALLPVLLVLGGCASAPTGPAVMALPGSGKSFEAFRQDDLACRQFAAGRGDRTQAASDAGVRSAVVGTVVGAVAGAAIGGQHGAAAGAGTGLVVGSLAGVGAADSSARATQRQYDNAYVQCMYGRGQRVPLTASLARSLPSGAPVPTRRAPPPNDPPPAPAFPPPPPGTPPPR